MKSFFTFLSRNKLYAIIEALGLALAFGFIIILAAYARTAFSVGTRQPLSQRLYAIGTANSFGMTLGTAEEFFPSVPEIEAWTRIADNGDMDITIGDEYYAVKAAAVDTTSLLIKVTGDRKEASEKIADVWRKVAKTYLGVPKEPEMHYLDEFLSSSITGERHTMTLVCLFMWLSILISALGLFAMSIYYAKQQQKTIALHKIAGAETHQAVLKLSRPFVAASLTAIVLATPISLRLMQHYLEGFYNRIPFPWWVLVAAAAISFVISVLSILGQTLKAAWANPTESIKFAN